MLNVPIVNISFGTVLLIVFIPYSLYCVFMCFVSRSERVGASVFFIFYAYMILRADGSMTRMVLCVAAFINLWGITCGSVKTDKIRQIIEIFALLNVALIIIQTLSYYGLHLRLQYIPQAIIHREFQESYVFRDTSGLYRPSALFLEPSHFSQYCCFALISVLFPNREKVDIKRAILIGIGCILTTSGMGIMITFGIFAWYMFLNSKSKESKLLKILKWIPVLIVGVFILLQIPFFQTALQRVFSNVEGYNAIAGRTKQWQNAIGPMSGATLWIGYGNSAEFPYYLTGLADTIYKFGIIGVVLQFICFLNLMVKKISNYVWCCCIVFILLFCFAHLTSFFSQVFYFGIVAADVMGAQRRRFLKHIF